MFWHKSKYHSILMHSHKCTINYCSVYKWHMSCTFHSTLTSVWSSPEIWKQHLRNCRCSHIIGCRSAALHWTKCLTADEELLWSSLPKLFSQHKNKQMNFIRAFFCSFFLPSDWSRILTTVIGLVWAVTRLSRSHLFLGVSEQNEAHEIFFKEGLR